MTHAVSFNQDSPKREVGSIRGSNKILLQGSLEGLPSEVAKLVLLKVQPLQFLNMEEYKGTQQGAWRVLPREEKMRARFEFNG